MKLFSFCRGHYEAISLWTHFSLVGVIMKLFYFCRGHYEAIIFFSGSLWSYLFFIGVIMRLFPNNNNNTGQSRVKTELFLLEQKKTPIFPGVPLLFQLSISPFGLLFSFWLLKRQAKTWLSKLKMVTTLTISFVLLAWTRFCVEVVFVALLEVI